MSLVNKVALVTGASSGIGAAIAVKLTEEGAKVAICGRKENKLKNVAELCEKRGSKPLAIIADVSKDVDAKRLVTETLKNFGKLDILVNNAGIGNNDNILADEAIDSFDKVISTNLRAPVLLTHLAAKHLTDTKGNIVNISSIAGEYVMTRRAFAYCTSKAALNHFTRCAALELAANGIRVNSVCPGPVKTDIIENTGVDKGLADQIWNAMKKSTALDRIADPEEIADVVAFLASDKARSITGSTIVSDNGALLTGPGDQHLYR